MRSPGPVGVCDVLRAEPGLPRQLGLAGAARPPCIDTWLVRETGQKVAPAYYVIACAAVSLVAILFMRERSRDDHDW